MWGLELLHWSWIFNFLYSHKFDFVELCKQSIWIKWNLGLNYRFFLFLFSLHSFQNLYMNTYFTGEISLTFSWNRGLRIGMERERLKKKKKEGRGKTRASWSIFDTYPLCHIWFPGICYGGNRGQRSLNIDLGRPFPPTIINLLVVTTKKWW